MKTTHKTQASDLDFISRLNQKLQPGPDPFYHGNPVSRFYEECPGCLPWWRHDQVELYLKASDDELAELMRREPDSYIRNLLRFRRNQPCEMHDLIEFAWNCHANNERTLLASLIKSLVVADCPSAEIASRLRTSVEKIDMYVSIFWDLRERLKYPDTVSDFIVPFVELDSLNAAEICDGLLLRAAWLQGMRGIEQLLTPTVALTDEERKISEILLLEAAARKLQNWEIAMKLGFIFEEPMTDRYMKTVERLYVRRSSAETVKRSVRFNEVLAQIASGTRVHEFIQFRVT